MDATIPDSAEPPYARQTVLLELDKIDLGERLRTIKGSTVQHLAESMSHHGLQTPIHVRKDGEGYVLVSGAHRVQAARSLVWPSIEAFVLDTLDEDTLALLEIDENLMRAELNAQDRGRFMSKRKEIYERLYPDTRRGGDRRSSAFRERQNLQNSDDLVSAPKNFVVETASITPFSPWTIRRAIRIGEKILPELHDELAMTAIAHREGDLYRISRMSSEEQEALLEDIQTAEHEIQKLADIYPRRQPSESSEDSFESPTSTREPEPEKSTLERLQTLWISATEDDRQQFLAWLDPMKSHANSGQLREGR